MCTWMCDLHMCTGAVINYTEALILCIKILAYEHEGDNCLAHSTKCPYVGSILAGLQLDQIDTMQALKAAFMTLPRCYAELYTVGLLWVILYLHTHPCSALTNTF